ncbi:MAG: hypothetical protein H6Q10_1200 [Acidobacteria bacterium]|nr:hypothetical protein [Acidobacteriota bacterium]
MPPLPRLVLPGLVLAGLAALPPAGGQEPADNQGPAPGRIAERVTCAAAPGQSYALYLPSRYSRERQWPVVYAFDAGARGVLPVERFRDAAEKYGYILAGSNNSRNGPIAVADEALRAMLADTAARFPTDPRRVYFTGFSGGARVAVLAAASLGPRVAGVIGCAAGFPLGTRPSAAAFAYFGTVGTDDFNFPEMRQLDEALDKAGVRHRIEVFEGPHDWPPPDLCTRAIEWMEIDAIRSRRRPADEGLIGQLLRDWAEGAAAAEKAGRPYEAWTRYTALAASFAGLRDVAAYERKARELAGSREVRRALAEQAGSIERQLSAQARLSRLSAQAVAGEDKASATLELLQALDILKSDAERPASDAARMAARRVLVSSWSQLNEAVAQDLEGGQLARAAERLSLMARLRPDNARVDYTLARVHARAGRTAAAVDALRRAVGKGFADAAAIEAEPDFAPLRDEEGFRQIVASLRHGAEAPSQPRSPRLQSSATVPVLPPLEEVQRGLVGPDRRRPLSGRALPGGVEAPVGGAGRRSTSLGFHHGRHDRRGRRRRTAGSPRAVDPAARPAAGPTEVGTRRPA